MRKVAVVISMDTGKIAKNTWTIIHLSEPMVSADCPTEDCTRLRIGLPLKPTDPHCVWGLNEQGGHLLGTVAAPHLKDLMKHYGYELIETRY